MNSNLPKWMSMTKGGSRTSAYSKKKKKASPTKGNVSSGGMVKKGKRKAYLDSL